jgi:hypothetical protein
MNRGEAEHRFASTSQLGDFQMSVKLAGCGAVTFTGNNGAGAISVDGIQSGDFLIVFQNEAGSWQPESGTFQNKVATTGQIQQTLDADMSSTTFTALVVRPT